MATMPQSAGNVHRIRRFSIAPPGTDRAIQQTIAQMKRLVLGPEGVYNAQVRAAAVQAARGAAYKNDSAERDSVFRWVKNNIEFRGEYAETLQSPLVTLQLKAGDCDDHSVLLAALLISLGHRVRFNTISVSRHDPQFTHVFAEAYDRQTGEWIPLDSTVRESYAGWLPRGITRSRTWGTLGDAPPLVPIPQAPTGLSPKGQAIYDILAPLSQAAASQLAHGTTPAPTAGLNIGLSTSSDQGIPGWLIWGGAIALFWVVANSGNRR